MDRRGVAAEPEEPRGRIRRTRLMMLAAALIMSVYIVGSVLVVTLLIPAEAFDTVNIFAVAAGRTSLADAAWAADGKRRNAATRAHVAGELARRGFTVIPSQANFIMFETRKPVKPLIAALKERGVEVGRLFPALPTHLRVTIGRPDDMERFLSAFAAVVA